MPYIVYTPLEWVNGSLAPGTAKYVDGAGNVTDTHFNPLLLNAGYASSTSQQKPRVDLSQLDTTVPTVLFTFNALSGTVDFAVSDLADWHDATGAPVNNPDDIRPLEYDPAAINATATPGNNGSDNAATRRPYLSLLKLPNNNDSRLFKLWNYDNSGQPRRNVVIVPGSVVVTGPDQNPGPHRGLPITYTQVSRTSPQPIGPNQYMVNYQDQPGALSSSDPLSAIGTIFFCGTTPMPETWRDAQGNTYRTPVTVTFQVQNNTYFDSNNTLQYAMVRADYITRELMSTAVGVRLYDLNSGQPQQVTLTQKFRIRNALR
jgi:hypothetical protein